MAMRPRKQGDERISVFTESALLKPYWSVDAVRLFCSFVGLRCRVA